MIHRLDGVGRRGKTEKQISGDQGVDGTGGVQLSLPLLDIENLVNRFGTQRLIDLGLGFQNKMDGVDGVVILVIGDKMADILLAHGISSFFCIIVLRYRDFNSEMTLFHKYREILYCHWKDPAV
jgi:hypothetical protein